MASDNNRGKLVTRILLLIVSLLATTILIIISPYIIKIRNIEREMSKIADSATADTFRTSETSICYDAYGNELAKFSGIKDLYYVTSDEIPEYVKNAFVVMEDRSFYDHSGIDIKGIIRAVVANITNGGITQGASTITQQLAKNTFLTQDVTWERKIKEIILSEKLEKKFTKDEILEFYLNNIYFGNGYYGIEAACRGYFGKTISETSLSEIAFLSSIPNNPQKYDPYTNYEKTLERRNLVLNTMYNEGAISGLDRELARTDEIVVVQDDEQKLDYVETYIFYCATRALMQKNGFVFRYMFDNENDEEIYDEQYSRLYSEYQASLFTGGYRIYTSIEPDKQTLLQQAVDEGLAEFDSVNEDGIYELQGASTCINNDTGMVAAIVGGRSQDTEGYTLNRAYQSYRQPGSSIKPLNVYTPYLELGHNPDSLVSDTYTSGGPKNADGVYLGAITLEKAVWLSKNAAAWNVYQEITPSYGMQFLIDMEFKRIDPVNDYGLAGSLGGFTYGVSTVEMASGFATLNNDGKFIRPGCVVKITDSQGNMIVDNQNPEQKVIYEANAARMMTSILHDDLLYGTGKNINISDGIAAGKTGTTNDNKDGYFVGYTRYYTTSVWVGYDMPRELEGLYGATYPGRIWNQYMEQIHEGKELKEFDSYTNYDENNSGTSATGTDSNNAGDNLGENARPSGDGDSNMNSGALPDAEIDIGTGIDSDTNNNGYSGGSNTNNGNGYSGGSNTNNNGNGYSGGSNTNNGNNGGTGTGGLSGDKNSLGIEEDYTGTYPNE